MFYSDATTNDIYACFEAGYVQSQSRGWSILDTENVGTPLSRGLGPTCVYARYRLNLNSFVLMEVNCQVTCAVGIFYFSSFEEVFPFFNLRIARDLKPATS